MDTLSLLPPLIPLNEGNRPVSKGASGCYLLGLQDSSSHCIGSVCEILLLCGYCPVLYDVQMDLNIKLEKHFVLIHTPINHASNLLTTYLE